MSPPASPLPRLYGDLASLWPIMSPPRDYEPEAMMMRHAIEDHFPGLQPRVFELGSGGGHSIVHLKHWCREVVGVDLSPAMIDLSRGLNPECEHHVADMRTVRLGRMFDVVLIHDAIDYMTTPADVRSALETAAAHLDAEGLLIVCPTYTAETFTPGETAADANGDEATELHYVCRVDDPDPDDHVHHLDLLMLWRRAGRLHVARDRHTCGLFADREWQRMFTEAGFTCLRYDADDSPFGMYVGMRGEVWGNVCATAPRR